jgi:hypothetical protein
MFEDKLQNIFQMYTVVLQVVTNILDKHLVAIFYFIFSFFPEDGGDVFFRNAGNRLQDCTESQFRSQRVVCCLNFQCYIIYRYTNNFLYSVYDRQLMEKLWNKNKKCTDTWKLKKEHFFVRKLLVQVCRLIF